MKRQTFRKFLLASSLLHFLAWTSSHFVSLPDNTPRFQTIELAIQEKAPELSPIEKEELKKQIVDQSEKALNDELDENAKFLSRNNQKALKQTVALNRGEFKNRTAQTTNTQKLTLAQLTPKMDFSKMVQSRDSKEQEFDKTAAKLAQEKKPEGKTPNPRQPTSQQQASEASQTLDYIKELDPGLETILSTREFLYYSFYSRVREQLNQHWGAKVRENLAKVYNQGRNIASSDDKITKVLVTLDRQGRLVKVQIIGNSGIRELDEAAAESFRSAAPFLNPPAGIVEPDGTIRLRWDFILEA